MKRLIILISATFLIIISVIYINSLPSNRYAYETVNTQNILKDKIKLGLPDNIYVHATNSPQRASEYAKFYTNFELDLYINQTEDILDIMHWPSDSSIKFHLEELIKITNKSSNPHYWLDVKNLNIDNLDIIDMHLKKILNKYKNLKKDNFLIESSNYNALGMIRRMGYKTSAYLHLPKEKCPEKDKLIKLSSLLNSNSDYYSFPLSVSSVVKNCLTPYVDKKPMLTWSNDGINSIVHNNKEEYEMFVVHHFYERSFLEKVLARVSYNISIIRYNLDSKYINH